jgi:hypothetical protein
LVSIAIPRHCAVIYQAPPQFRNKAAEPGLRKIVRARNGAFRKKGGAGKRVALMQAREMLAYRSANFGCFGARTVLVEPRFVSYRHFWHPILG